MKVKRRAMVNKQQRVRMNKKRRASINKQRKIKDECGR